MFKELLIVCLLGMAACRPLDTKHSPPSGFGLQTWHLLMGLAISGYIAFLGLVGVATPANSTLAMPTAPSEGSWRQWVLFTCTCPAFAFLNGSLAVSIFLGRGNLTSIIIKTACTSLIAGGVTTTLGYVGSYLARAPTPSVDVVIQEVDQRIRRQVSLQSGFTSEEMIDLFGEDVFTLFDDVPVPSLPPRTTEFTPSTKALTSTTKTPVLAPAALTEDVLTLSDNVPAPSLPPRTTEFTPSTKALTSTTKTPVLAPAALTEALNTSLRQYPVISLAFLMAAGLGNILFTLLAVRYCRAKTIRIVNHEVPRHRVFEPIDLND